MPYKIWPQIVGYVFVIVQIAQLIERTNYYPIIINHDRQIIFCAPLHWHFSYSHFW